MEFENQVLIFKEFDYKITLRMLLKTENEVFNLNNKRCFLIKTEDIIVFFKKLSKKTF